MAYAEAARAQISASIKYRSLKFSTLPNANANDIARALLFRVQLDEIEAIQQDPGKGNWSTILKSISTAEKLAEREFTLLKQQVFPTPYNARWIAATVAFAPPGTTADDIVEALADCVEVKQVLPIFLKDFPTIKSGKYHVTLNHAVKDRLKKFYLLTSPCTGIKLHCFTQVPVLQLSQSPWKRLSSQRTKKVFSL